MGICISPWRKTGESIDLPCGKCYECKRKRVSGWSYRILKEAERSSSAFFFTLTIAPEHIKLTKNGFMSLYKEDVQKFMKRLRKTQTNKIKYYAVGEYGTKDKRPHYHLLLFNVDLSTLLTEAEYKMVKNGTIQLNGKTPMSIKEWKEGHITIGQLNVATSQYTLKYVSKDANVPEHERDDRLKPFSLMSKKLGDNYLTKQKIRWHKKDILNRMYVPLKDGKKISMPRYYKDKIYTKHQKNLISAHLKNQECGKLSNEELAYIDLIRINESKKSQKETRNTTL